MTFTYSWAQARSMSAKELLQREIRNLEFNVCLYKEEMSEIHKDTQQYEDLKKFLVASQRKLRDRKKRLLAMDVLRVPDICDIIMEESNA